MRTYKSDVHYTSFVDDRSYGFLVVDACMPSSCFGVMDGTEG